MRVQDRNPWGTSAPETGRTPETQKAGREEAGRTGGTRSSDNDDRVELSSELGRLSQAIATHNTQRTDRVQALATDYQRGAYRPNAQQTSHAMVAEALSEGG